MKYLKYIFVLSFFIVIQPESYANTRKNNNKFIQWAELQSLITRNNKQKETTTYWDFIGILGSPSRCDDKRRTVTCDWDFEEYQIEGKFLDSELVKVKKRNI